MVAIVRAAVVTIAFIPVFLMITTLLMIPISVAIAADPDRHLGKLSDHDRLTSRYSGRCGPAQAWSITQSQKR